jgi:radical SAM protein
MSNPTMTQPSKGLWKRNFAENPFIAIWEVTRACQLHCLHCRAKAQRRRDPRELTTEEGFALIDQIAAMDKPLLVFTGGDPLEREDLFDFIAYGKAQGLEVAMTPSATPRVTMEALARAQACGLSRCAFSLDGSTPEIHDRFRGTRGSYGLTMSALHALREIGMPIQVNTTVSRYNVDDLGRIADLVESFGAVLWSVFFLVPTGRGRAQDMVDAVTAERIMEWLYEQAQVRSFDIKTTAAPHYRRVVIQHRQAGGPTGPQSGFLLENHTLRSARGVNDGNGFVFISHIGDLYPSGFLPVTAGNVRTTPLAELYRNSPLFQELRNPALLEGKCGVCEFRGVCGGSRARAYGVTGDYLASDPLCAYIPRSFAEAENTLS